MNSLIQQQTDQPRVCRDAAAVMRHRWRRRHPQRLLWGAGALPEKSGHSRQPTGPKPRCLQLRPEPQSPRPVPTSTSSTTQERVCVCVFVMICDTGELSCDCFTSLIIFPSVSNPSVLHRDVQAQTEALTFCHSLDRRWIFPTSCCDLNA